MENQINAEDKAQEGATGTPPPLSSTTTTTAAVAEVTPSLVRDLADAFKDTATSPDARLQALYTLADVLPEATEPETLLLRSGVLPALLFFPADDGGESHIDPNYRIAAPHAEAPEEAGGADGTADNDGRDAAYHTAAAEVLHKFVSVYPAARAALTQLVAAPSASRCVYGGGGGGGGGGAGAATPPVSPLRLWLLRRGSPPCRLLAARLAVDLVQHARYADDVCRGLAGAADTRVLGGGLLAALATAAAELGPPNEEEEEDEGTAPSAGNRANGGGCSGGGGAVACTPPDAAAHLERALWEISSLSRGLAFSLRDAAEALPALVALYAAERGRGGRERRGDAQGRAGAGRGPPLVVFVDLRGCALAVLAGLLQGAAASAQEEMYMQREGRKGLRWVTRHHQQRYWRLAEAAVAADVPRVLCDALRSRNSDDIFQAIRAATALLGAAGGQAAGNSQHPTPSAERHEDEYEEESGVNTGGAAPSPSFEHDCVHAFAEAGVVGAVCAAVGDAAMYKQGVLGLAALLTLHSPPALLRETIVPQLLRVLQGVGTDAATDGGEDAEDSTSKKEEGAERDRRLRSAVGAAITIAHLCRLKSVTCIRDAFLAGGALLRAVQRCRRPSASNSISGSSRSTTIADYDESEREALAQYLPAILSALHSPPTRPPLPSPPAVEAALPLLLPLSTDPDARVAAAALQCVRGWEPCAPAAVAAALRELGISDPSP